MRLPAGSKATRGVRYHARWRTPDGASRIKTFAVEGRRRGTSGVGRGRQVPRHLRRSIRRHCQRRDVPDARRIATRRTRAGTPLAKRTRDLYEQLLRTHIQPTLGAVRLRDVTPDAVRAWRAALPGDIAPAKAYRLLRAVMTTVNDELIARNPCKVEGGGAERSPERPIPTRDEVWALADAIEPRFRALVLVTAFVGLRWEELAMLRRADVDLEERTVAVRREARKSDGRSAQSPCLRCFCQSCVDTSRSTPPTATTRTCAPAARDLCSTARTSTRTGTRRAWMSVWRICICTT